MKIFFNDKNLLNPPIARAAYSDRTAWLMAEFSRLAYVMFESNVDLLDQALTDGGFKRVQIFNKNGTQAFLAKNEVMAVLAFRGTEANRVDFLTDLKARFVKTDAGEMHNGFDTAYGLIQAEVKLAIDQIKDLPIYITGHSLGAALATIAAYELERDNLAACYTFGSPRVGDRNLDWKIKTPVYRVVNRADIVTNIPLMAMNYQHVGSLFYIIDSDEIIRSPSGVRILFRWLSVVFKKMSQTLDDHAILGYCEKLEKIAVRRNLVVLP